MVVPLLEASLSL
jgi:hypothetical protein